MEIVFVNLDYEETLYSKNPFQISSNKKNQQFEFFAWLLGHQNIYSSRVYDESYLNFIKKITNEKNILVSSEKPQHYFWGNLNPLDEMRKLNSKMTSTSFAIENNLCHESAHLINGPYTLKFDEIAKNPFSFSGRGHYVGPKQIETNEELIIEKKLERVLDFSALCFKEKTIFYQNIVDERFQYRGSLISQQNEIPYFLDETISKQYIKDLKKIREYFDYGLEYEESYSVDSFLYKDKNEVKLYSLCEVNYRSTMGKMAYLLSKKYLKGFHYHFLGLSKNLPEDRESESHLHLSSRDNLFHVILLGANSESEITLLRQKFNC